MCFVSTISICNRAPSLSVTSWYILCNLLQQIRTYMIQYVEYAFILPDFFLFYLSDIMVMRTNLVNNSVSYEMIIFKSPASKRHKSLRIFKSPRRKTNHQDRTGTRNAPCRERVRCITRHTETRPTAAIIMTWCIEFASANENKVHPGEKVKMGLFLHKLFIIYFL